MIFGKLIAAAAIATMALAKNDLLEEVTSYGSSWTRGLYSGFQVGYFRANTTLSKNCLDKDWQKVFVDTLTKDKKKEPFNFAEFAGNSVWLSLAVQNECRFNSALYQYLNYCLDNTKCSPYTMVETLSGKLFQVSSIAGGLASFLAADFPTLDDSEKMIEDYATRIGTDLGKILRIANSFSN